MSLCEVPGCNRPNGGAVIIEGQEYARLCSEHLTEHRAICARMWDEIEAGVNPALAVRREWVRREKEGKAE